MLRSSYWCPRRAVPNSEPAVSAAAFSLRGVGLRTCQVRRSDSYGHSVPLDRGSVVSRTLEWIGERDHL
jgi:hypothetical protein